MKATKGFYIRSSRSNDRKNDDCGLLLQNVACVVLYIISESLFGRRMRPLCVAMFITAVVILCLLFLPGTFGPYSFWISISWGLCAMLIFIIGFMRYQHLKTIYTSIQMECVELTNRTGTATFQLVPTCLYQEEHAKEIWEFRHIDVVISDNVINVI